MAKATFRATTPFVAATKNGSVRVQVGDVFDSSDPVYKGRESLFEPVETAAARKPYSRSSAPVEQTTAAPGEVRAVDLPD